MTDGMPVKKRWKIDFSSKCSKNVVSFSKTSEAKEKAVKSDAVTEAASEVDEAPISPPDMAETLMRSADQPEVLAPVEAPMAREEEEEEEDDDEEEEEEEEIDEPSKNGMGELERDTPEALETENDIEETKVHEIETKAEINVETSFKVETEIEPLENVTQTSDLLSQSPLKIKIMRTQNPVEPEIDEASKDPVKPIPRKKKKKVMVTIQNYNSDDEDEPVQKTRPQRRSKPSMMDLRDQHRVFNTTSFVKERQPLDVDAVHDQEARHDVLSTAVAAPDASPPLIGVQLPVHAPAAPAPAPEPTLGRLMTSSSDDTEDGLPLSQYVPKKTTVNEKAVDDKLLKKVKKKKLKKKKKDPQEPQKPVSAYALFFRDMQSSIKAENPEASFGEISKIVANQWDALDDSKKTNYKKKTETAKKDYLKKLAAYKANRISSEPMVERPVAEPPQVAPLALPASCQSGPVGFVPSVPVSGPQLYEESPRPEPLPAFATQSLPGGEYEPGPHVPAPASILSIKPGICVNDGCTNLAIEDARWDREYCSTECVVQHCREAFQSWVLHRQDYAMEPVAASVTY